MGRFPDWKGMNFVENVSEIFMFLVCKTPSMDELPGIPNPHKSILWHLHKNRVERYVSIVFQLTKTSVKLTNRHTHN